MIPEVEPPSPLVLLGLHHCEPVRALELVRPPRPDPDADEPSRRALLRAAVVVDCATRGDGPPAKCVHAQESVAPTRHDTVLRAACELHKYERRRRHLSRDERALPTRAGVGLSLSDNCGRRSRAYAERSESPNARPIERLDADARHLDCVSRRYARLRRAERTGPDDPVDQEINYNTGRFYHGLGLYSAALNWYLDVSRPRGFFSLAADEPRRHRGPRQDPRRAATP